MNTDPNAETITDQQTQAMTSSGGSATQTGRGATSVQGMSLVPGDVLRERYEIDRELGRGGIGVVLLARDRAAFGRPVVVKMLLDRSEGNEYLWTKFLQEGEALAKIDHPSVVKILETGTLDGGRPFLVMEFVEGGSLRTVSKSGGMDFGQVAVLVKQICGGLQAAHAKGIVHRDLKPDNVMLQTLDGGDRHAKLIDFGVAKQAESAVAKETSAAMTVGTLSYMAPEQLEGRATTASDIFAMGVLAYEMLTGKRPYEVESENPLVAINLMAQKQRTGTFPALRSLRPEVPETAETVIAAALAFEPEKRPATAKEFGERLAAALTETGQPGPTLAAEYPPAPTPLTPVPAPKPKSFNPVAIGVAAVLVIGGGLVFVARDSLFGSKPKPMPPKQVVTTPEKKSVTGYWLTVQNMRDKKPEGEAFSVFTSTVLRNGSRVRLTITPLADGHLYLISEGAQPRPDGLPLFVNLFPSAAIGDGGSKISSGKAIQMPDKADQWFVLDNQQGTEIVWLVWSPEPLTELEALRKFSNDTDKGAVNDPAAIKNLQEKLKGLAKAGTSEDETGKRMVLEGAGPIAHRIKLEHR